MIEVENLTKYYGPTVGIRDLSFKVSSGEVIGFLGPNGAGKTTLMKILTCFMPPTSGTARILGFDILRDSLEVRRRIGYLPEHVPLYEEMSVGEYLEFVSRLKGIPGRSIPGSVEYAIEHCGLESVFRRTVGKLSKGFRQRVGIGQAIIGEPEILILDEPTIGLDPKQIIEIRGLIKSLGTERTVILSSHILPEVSQICNRIIIINRGELAAAGSPENLQEQLKKSSVIRIGLKEPESMERAKDVILGIEGVGSIKEQAPQGETAYLTVESTTDIDLRGDIVKRLVEAGQPIVEVHGEELSLEDIFLRLVKEEGQ